MGSGSSKLVSGNFDFHEKIGNVLAKKKKFAVFVNGSFWHQHKGCKRANIPKSNKAYWIPKLNKNVEQQRKNLM